MYPASFQWNRASSFKEASEMLVALGFNAKLIAGGQTLIPMMKLRLLKPTDLIDISRIPSADAIEIVEDSLRIGALACHHAIGSSAVTQAYPLIRDCALGIADPQIRNMGSIGGGLAEADPSGCWPTSLIALDAAALCLGPDGERLVPVRELLVDAYTPALEDGEIITQIRIPLANLSATSAYVAFKRSAPAYPSASCALSIKFEDNVISDLRIGVGCAALVPFTLSDIQDAVAGQVLTTEMINQIADYATEVSDPFDDNRGTAGYKRSLISSLVRRAFANVALRREGPASVVSHSYYG